MAPSRVRSSSARAGRLFCRCRTVSWWRSTMNSRSFECPERTANRANEARNRYRTRHMEPQDRERRTCFSALRPSFGHPWLSAPTCVLKGSDDDVEDRRHDPCCASDGGRSSGVAVQAEIPNHRRLRRSRAGVVSAAVDVSLLAGRVCDEKTNMCEPLLTHRNEITMASKLGSVGGPGTKARCGGPSVGELPVCGPGGARCIGGVSSSQALAWNRRTCRPDRDGRRFWPREGEPQAADTASGRVPMRGTGADRPVVAVRAL